MSEVGLDLLGKALRLVPPNASSEEQIAALNDVISTLNNFNKDIVKSDIITFTSDGSGTTVLNVPHNLGYKPRAFAFLNDVNITAGGFVYTGVDLGLPTWISAGGSGGVVQFYIYLDYFVDATNLYIHCINAAGSAFSLPIKYFLTREATN